MEDSKIPPSIYNYAWQLDPGRSRKWKKPVYVTNLSNLEDYGASDPWFEDIPKAVTFWFSKDGTQKVTCMSHKTKCPNETKVGLVVLNKFEYTTHDTGTNRNSVTTDTLVG